MAWGDSSPDDWGGQGSIKLIPCWSHRRCHLKDVPTRSRSVDWERSGTHNPKSEVLDAPFFFVGRTPTGMEGTALLFSQEQLHQLRMLHQASPLLQGPPQAQDEQTSSSTTTNIQEEVRRQVSDFMSQQAQAMHRLQSEKEALREETSSPPVPTSREISAC